MKQFIFLFVAIATISLSSKLFQKKVMKLESIKILVGEIDYKLGRIEFFK